MDTIFMNFENSKISESYRLLLKLEDKMDLRREEIYVALSNLRMYFTWQNIKTSRKRNRFKMSAPTWKDEFKLPDGSYFVSDMQDYFEYMVKNHGEKTDSLSIIIYVNKIDNGITFKI